MSRCPELRAHAGRRHAAVRTALLLLATVVPGARADGGLTDPATLLRRSGQVQQFEVVATASSARRVRLRWGVGHVPVDVIFASEAVTAAQAQTVRRITVSVEIPAGRRPTAGQRWALRSVAQVLAAACLSGHPMTMMPRVEPGDRATRQLEVTFGGRGTTPRCRMPVGR